MVKRNHEREEMVKFYQNTSLEDIVYLNKDNNYYIVKTKDKIYVFDIDYRKVTSIDNADIQEKSLPLVYRRGQIYYEEVGREDGKLIYKYYLPASGELSFELSLGGA